MHSTNELNYTRAKFRLDCIENSGNYKQRHSPDGLLVAFYSAEVMVPKAKTQLARKNILGPKVSFVDEKCD